MKETIKKLLHIEPHIEPVRGRTGLPLYLTAGVSFYIIHVAESNFHVVELTDTDNTNLSNLRHGLERYEMAFAGNVAYCIRDLSAKKRDALIKAGIPFIAPPGQLYLPFLGMVLQDKFSKEKKAVKEKMSPVEQLLFLFLLYHRDAFTKAQLADRLHVTRAAVTKVTEELRCKKLILEKKEGKEVLVTLNGDPKACFSEAHRWMISPVKRIVYCAERRKCASFLSAGESALSDMSMLSSPRKEVRACYENDPRLEGLSVTDADGWEMDKGYTRLEVWKYNPEVISGGNTVDILSLSLSLADVQDERVQGELQEALEEKGWR